jgi:hypothetical protein
MYDGSFRVADNSHVLRFGADGEFLQELAKKGRGTAVNGRPTLI